jgi:thymidylate synthase
MNKLDKDYQALLQDILDNGVTKKDRTGTGNISVFDRQIRHRMIYGFKLLTSNSKLMVFSTSTIEESKKDDIRFIYNKQNNHFFQAEER